MVKVIKTFGERPEEVTVLSTKVQFDENGVAEVEDEEILAILDQVPGYERFEAKEEEPKAPEAPESPSEEEEKSEEDDEEEEEADAPKIPTRKAPVRKAPAIK